MRAAATLMHLDIALPATSPIFRKKQIICDLGCGDGEFLIGLLGHLNSSKMHLITQSKVVKGIGVDYDAKLIATATINAVEAEEMVDWLTYDFNEDQDDLCEQLVRKGVTHIFVYLVPKQLALKTVRAILTRLWQRGVVVCCHKFQPGYLVATRRDEVMDLVVYEKLISVVTL
jgi:hypothetical protein